MAKVKNQNVPSEFNEAYERIFFPTHAAGTGYQYFIAGYGYAELVAGLMNQYQAQKKGTEYPQVSERQANARCVFSKCSKAANDQVETGGTEYPESGPRNKSWWYENIPAGNCYWNDYCIQESYPHLEYHRRPPWSIAPTIWICATGNERLEKWNGRTMTLEDSTTGGGGAGQSFGSITRACVDEELVYVCDYQENKIRILNKETLAYIDDFSKTSDDEHTFSDPYDIGVDDKYLYIVEWQSNVIIMVDKVTHKLIKKVSVAGADDWTTPKIKGITVDHNYVSVADWINGFIKIYTRVGLSFVKMITVRSWDESPILYANGIVSDGNLIYAIDSSHIANYTCSIDLGEVISENDPANACTGGIGLSGDLVFNMGDLDNTLYKMIRTSLGVIDSLNNPGTDPGEFALNQGVCGEQAFYWDAC